MSNYIEDVQGKKNNNPINETNTEYKHNRKEWNSVDITEGNIYKNDESDNYNLNRQKMYNNAEPISVIDTEYTNEYRSTVERLRTQTESYYEALESALVPSIVPGMAIQPFTYFSPDEADESIEPKKILSEQYIFQDHPVNIDSNKHECVFRCNMIKFKPNRNRRLIYDRYIHILSKEGETAKDIAKRIYDEEFISNDKILDGISRLATDTESINIISDIAEKIVNNIKKEYFNKFNNITINTVLEEGININTGIPSTLYNLYKLGYVHPFLSFLNGSIVSWSNITISVDNKDVYLIINTERYNGSIYEITNENSMDLLFTYVDIPFKVDYIKYGQNLSSPINSSLSKYRNKNVVPIFLIESRLGAVFSDEDFKTMSNDTMFLDFGRHNNGSFDRIYTDDPYIVYEEMTIDPPNNNEYDLTSKLGKLFNYRFVDYDYRCKLKKFNFLGFSDIKSSVGHIGTLKDDFDVEWHQFNILNFTFDKLFNDKRRFKVFYNTKVLYDQDNMLRIRNKQYLANEFEKYRLSITANIEVFMKELYSLSKKDIGRYILPNYNTDYRIEVSYEYKTPYEVAELLGYLNDMETFKKIDMFKDTDDEGYYLFKYGAFVATYVNNLSDRDIKNNKLILPIDIHAYNIYEFDPRGAIIPDFNKIMFYKGIYVEKEDPDTKPDQLKIRYEFAHLDGVEEGSTPLDEFIYYKTCRTQLNNIAEVRDFITNQPQTSKDKQGTNLILKELSRQIFKDEETPDEVRATMNKLIDRMEYDISVNGEIIISDDNSYSEEDNSQMYNYGIWKYNKNINNREARMINSEWMIRRNIPEMFQYYLNENMAVTDMDILDEVFDFTYNDQTKYTDNLEKGVNYIIGYDADKLEASIKRSIVSMTRTGKELKTLFNNMNDPFTLTCTADNLNLTMLMDRNTRIRTNTNKVIVDIQKYSSNQYNKNIRIIIKDTLNGTTQQIISCNSGTVSGNNIQCYRKDGNNMDLEIPLLEINTNKTIRDVTKDHTVSYNQCRFNEDINIIEFLDDAGKIIVNMEPDEIIYRNKIKMSRWNISKNNNYVMIFKNGELYDKYNSILYNNTHFAIDFNTYDILDKDKFEFIFFLNANNNVIETIIEENKDTQLTVPKYNISTYKNSNGEEDTHKSGYTDGIYNVINDSNIQYNFNVAFPCETSLFDPENLLLLVNNIKNNQYLIDDLSLTNYELDYDIYSYKRVPMNQKSDNTVYETESKFNYANSYIYKDNKINGLYRVTKQGGGEYFVTFNASNTVSPPYILTLCSKRQFRYMQVISDITTTQYSCELDEEFKYCTKSNHFMIFKNNHLIPSNSVYVHSIKDTPINSLELYLSCQVNEGDKIDIFYITNDLHNINSEIINGKIIKNINDQDIKILENENGNVTSYIRLNSPLYTKGKHLYGTSSKHSLFIFLNGKKIPMGELEDISDTIIGIESDQSSCDRLEVFDHLDNLDILQKLYINDGLSHELFNSDKPNIVSIDITKLNNYTEETMLTKLLDNCTDEQLNKLFYDTPPKISKSNSNSIKDKDFLSRDSVINFILSKYPNTGKDWKNKL